MVQSGCSKNAVPVTEDRGAIPVAAMVESIVGCKWSVSLLVLLAQGSRRPSSLLRSCTGLSAKVMNERLQKMMRFGIVRRSVFGARPPVEVEYGLTPLGRRFMRILEEVRRLQEAVDHGAVPAADESRERAPRGGRPRRRGT